MQNKPFGHLVSQAAAPCDIVVRPILFIGRTTILPMQKKAQVPRTKWSNQQLERYIRSTAADSKKVGFSDHARNQMRKRHISVDTVFEVLRKGKILRQPELNANHGNLECRMEFYVSGEERKVVVAVSDEDENALVVTAF